MASIHQEIEQIANKVNTLGGVIIAAAVISAISGGAVYFLNLRKNALQKHLDDQSKQEMSAKVSSAEKMAKEERDARLALEARLAPRTLTAEQRGKLIEFLKKNKNSDPFALYVAFEADDGVSYYRELLGAFKEGAWNIRDGHRTTDRAEWGLAIIYKRDVNEPVPPIAHMIEKALASVGLGARIMSDSGPNAEPIPMLYIGTKTHQ